MGLSETALRIVRLLFGAVDSLGSLRRVLPAPMVLPAADRVNAAGVLDGAGSDREVLEEALDSVFYCTDSNHTVHIHLNPGSGVPIYRQIVDEVRAAFLKGHIRPGEKLPSVRELARSLGVNPSTVVKAYDNLENERLIARRQGRGAFVAGGVQPLLPRERRDAARQLARRLAIEGLRLGYDEEEIERLLRKELEKLKPRVSHR